MSKRAVLPIRVVVFKDSEPLRTENDGMVARVRTRAYEIAVSRGHAGQDMDNWFAAEAELMFTPPVELTEKAGVFSLRVPTPGLDPKDIQILMAPDQLIIKGKHPHRHEDDSETIHICEFKKAPLFRWLKFPGLVRFAETHVESANGLLTITVPRVATAPAKQEKQPDKQPAKAPRARRAAPARAKSQSGS